MVEVWLPYGRTQLSMRIPDENYHGMIEPKDQGAVEDSTLAITQSIQKPVGSKPLTSIAKAKDKVTIVVDDATRPTPTSLLIPSITAELTKSGVRREDITLLIATGLHRAPTKEEIQGIGGVNSNAGLKILVHDCRSQGLLHIGSTSHGTNVSVNETFAKADIRILTGDVELHPYAGYGGGRKSVLPGISAEETISQNHALSMHPNARPGVLDRNPVNEDMSEAAEMAKVDFIANVVLNAKGEIVSVASGDIHQAFLKGTRVVDDMFKIECDSKVDIAVVSTGGYPRDLTLYEALRAIHLTLDIVKEGGAMVLAAECLEGHGNQTFREWMTRFDGSREMEREIKRQFTVGAHEARYLMKVLEKVTIYLVSAIPDYYVSSIFKMRPSRTANAALQSALRNIGKDSKVAVVPYGASTLPMFHEDAEGKPART
jgi:nickel-dependent lactate racemase